MNIKNFLSLFPGTDEYSVASLFEDILLCQNIDFPVYTDTFYSPQIWKILSNYTGFKNLKFKFFGLTEESEKKLISILPKDFSEDELIPPIKYFIIDGQNKFKTLEHKDFLGTIMSLGIKRELLGDLIVSENICYGIAMENIFDFLSKNITSIGKIPAKLQEITPEKIPALNFKEIFQTVSSLRLDSMISAVTNFSRNESVALIESGSVMLNYRIEKDKSKPVSPQDIITISKKGKFIFVDALGENKKGKIKIFLKKFI